MNTYLSPPTDGSEKLSDNSPGAASITSAEIADEFASLSFEEQERLRSEWSQVSKRIRNQIASTLKLIRNLIRFPGIGSCRRGDCNVAYGFDIESTTCKRIETQIGHHRLA